MAQSSKTQNQTNNKQPQDQKDKSGYGKEPARQDKNSESRNNQSGFQSPNEMNQRSPENRNR